MRPRWPARPATKRQDRAVLRPSRQGHREPFQPTRDLERPPSLHCTSLHALRNHSHRYRQWTSRPCCSSLSYHRARRRQLCIRDADPDGRLHGNRRRSGPNSADNSSAEIVEDRIRGCSCADRLVSATQAGQTVTRSPPETLKLAYLQAASTVALAPPCELEKAAKRRRASSLSALLASPSPPSDQTATAAPVSADCNAPLAR